MNSKKSIASKQNICSFFAVLFRTERASPEGIWIPGCPEGIPFPALRDFDYAGLIFAFPAVDFPAL